MPDGDDVTTPPAIPQQRAPVWYQVPPAAEPFPAAVPASGPFLASVAGPELFPAPARSGRRALTGGIFALVAALILAGGALYVANRNQLAAPAEAAENPRPRTPLEAADAALNLQAAALVRGDEKAWLAAVDPGQPKLRTRYRSMFRSLRTLGVSAFEYQTSRDGTAQDRAVKLEAYAVYCLKDNTCPADAKPAVLQKLTLKIVKDQWLITASTTPQNDDTLQPPPWEDGGLVTVKGKRVTLVALPSEKKYFKKILPIADAAAAVNDRFAAMVDNPQKRYRIYLAGNKQWKRWYGGITDEWVVGYAVPLNEAGMDVVLHMNDLKSETRLLETTIQHELGHVVTLGEAHRKSWGEGDMWLKEGIAEYIGWYPQPATASWRRQSVRDHLRGSDRPTSIAVTALKSDARVEDGDAFYGMGHFAADCMAKKYGQRALFTFARLYLREEKDLDPAARQAFGQPFRTVDKTCLAWIRDKA
ncbi:hypothetical protein [Actinoplanes sp. NPDC051494]|uniref:hypothetical protein n=1 Tax=Actinoplanes sp. NPDC051494 TaxID=3363907 RepID=UPI00379FF68F